VKINITITSEDYKNHLRLIRNFLRSGDFGRRDSLKAITIRIVFGISIGLVAAYVFMSLGLRLDESVFCLASQSDKTALVNIGHKQLIYI